MAHFNVEVDDDQEITKQGRLIVYHEPEGKFKVELPNGDEKVMPVEKLNQLKWQKWEPTQQQNLLEHGG